MEQSFKTRGVLKNEFLQHDLSATAAGAITVMHGQTAKAPGVDPKTAEAIAVFEHQAVESKAAGEHGVQGLLGDGDQAEREVPEPGEVGLAGSRVGELAEAEMRDAEGGREAQRGRRHRRRGRRREAVGDVELLEAVEGRGPEPAVEAGEREVGDGEAAGRAPVRCEDAGDGDLVDVRAAAAGHEVEQRREPERAPPGGERLRARAILGGEERDDVAEDLVGEKADQIGAGATSCHNFLPRNNS